MRLDAWGRCETASQVFTGPQILVVDDEAVILELMAQILLAEGFTVRTAKTGPDALRIFQSQPTISLAILDWRMPGMTGEQVFDELAKKRPDVKVIVATGNDRSDVERAFAGRSVVRFLEKPFTPEVLVSAVRSTLAG